MNPAAIQILRRDLGLSDLRYRGILFDVAQVTSSKQLSDDAAREVYRRISMLATAEKPAARYVWVLWGKLKSFLSAGERRGNWFCGFVRRAAGVELEDLTCLDDLSGEELHKVIEALKQRIAYEESRLAAEVPF